MSRPSRTIHSEVLGCPNSRASCQCSGLDPEQTSKPVTAPASSKLDHVSGPSVETTLILPGATLLQGEAFPANKSEAKAFSLQSIAVPYNLFRHPKRPCFPSAALQVQLAATLVCSEPDEQVRSGFSGQNGICVVLK